MSKSKQLDPVEQLIAEATEGGARVKLPSADALAALKRVCEHNDNCKMSERVSRERTRKMLDKSFGWKGGDQALDNVCQRALNRKSYTRAS